MHQVVKYVLEEMWEAFVIISELCLRSGLFCKMASTTQRSFHRKVDVQ